MLPYSPGHYLAIFISRLGRGGGGQGGGRAHDVLLSLDHRGDVYTYRQWDMAPSTGGAPAGRSLELVT